MIPLPLLLIGQAVAVLTLQVTALPAPWSVDQPVEEGSEAFTTLTDDTFAAAITAGAVTAAADTERGGDLRVVLFGAPWCRPCHAIKGTLAALATRGRIPDTRLYYVDAEASLALGRRYTAGGIPVIHFFYRGAPVEVESEKLRTVDGGVVGLLDADDLAALIHEVQETAREGYTVLELR